MKQLIITILFITLSSLLLPCISHRIPAHSTHDQTHYVELAFGKLHRKLRSVEVPMVQELVNGDYKSKNAKYGGLTGDFPTKEKQLDQEPDTREGDMQQFMTMDYSRPRRRRPMHNRAVSGAP